MDSSGTMADGLQGAYSRGFCRALAEGLSRIQLCEVDVCFTFVTMDGIKSWAVSGREWTVNEVLEIAWSKDIDFISLGTLVLTERLELHLVLVSPSQRRSLLDRTFSYPRAQIPSCLTEIVAAIGVAIVGRPLNPTEVDQLARWGTNSTDAYLAYLEAWEAGRALRLGLSVPNPQQALELALSATRTDPEFQEGYRLQESLKFGATSFGLAGYSEHAYQIEVPNQATPPSHAIGPPSNPILAPDQRGQ
jgi:hypothetical protein